MSFQEENLFRISGGIGHGTPAGSSVYVYREDTDSKATVSASGYFTNTFQRVNFVAYDVIIITGAQGTYTRRVTSVVNKSVTTSAGSDSVTGGDWTDITTDYTVLPTDAKIFTTGTLTITLESVTDNDQREIIIKKDGAGNVTIDADGDETIDDNAQIFMTNNKESAHLIVHGGKWHRT